ncbi:hypothetical protein AOL_s00043g57 [Orbilia oligospora ATCC 24927]|uniref:polynucleotide adenylyltransferase n=1 Tax=Arthrobotrys oligospora (strain ATCC 24927 / CBS 115.81 / DSM 1491) TaxID=756982 RepID=G1X2Y4_ARTOA|nr:hypothetical protein AOL_s00043g57 [Orbilia oligospora ATCC 24927]EGX52268.1 hypothetical protein AOL_s00043g57 [Orbilia oligospora ATCC 24927]
MNRAENHLSQGPSNRGLDGPQNLEAKLRGMLRSDQVTNQLPMQPVQPVQPAPGQYAQLPMTSAPPPGLIPSPNIHRQQHPPPMLQRSSTVPSHGFAPRQPPTLDRAGTFYDGMPSPPFNGPAAYQSPRSRGGGGRWGRSNGFQHAPVPQINNTLHFPPLGTVPTQPPPPPLSEHRFPPNMNNSRRYSGAGNYQHDKPRSPILNRNEPFYGPPGQYQGFGGSPPQNRRGQRQHNYRGSHNGGTRSYRQFVPLDYTQMTDYAKSVVQSISPTPDEIAMKSSTLRRITEICNNLVPGSRIIPFGSLVSGFATKGADMDVIFAHDSLHPQPFSHESNVPVRLANEFLKRGFEVDLLIRTRVPILKIKTPSNDPGSRPGSPSAQDALKEDLDEEPWPENISCDIGFKAHLGITNSYFFRTYSQCDSRFREMVLFVKQWSKNRDLNSPYFGTLSSYGYVLMVAHFLINIVKPPVLPNLQLIPPDPDTPESELRQDGFDIWYFKDIAKITSGELLPDGKNEMGLGQLIYEFFQYFTTNFNFVSEVVTIRSLGGVMYKQHKGWTSARERVGETTTYQDRYLLALEDPFEITHNVGRTCGGPGVRRIRGEMQRAAQIIRKISTQAAPESPATAARNSGWEMQITLDDLMVTVTQNNRTFRNRKNNQKNLVGWIKNNWTVGECLAQIDAVAEELRRKRELGLPDDAELPLESEEGSEETDGEEGSDSGSSGDSSIRVVSSEANRVIEGLNGLRISRS